MRDNFGIINLDELLLYDLNEIKQGIYLQDVVSRKKQMLPLLMDFLEKNN